MTIVLRPGESMDDVVASGIGGCPRCGGALRRWGNARWRVVRQTAGQSALRPGRVRCGDCGVTQVVLPADVLVRRRDAAVVVGRAWRYFAEGAGARRVARRVGVPMETVRGWLRRLRLIVPLPYRGPRPPQRNYLAWVLASVVAEAQRAGWQEEADLWPFVAYRSQGRLLSNTSSPWSTAQAVT